MKKLFPLIATALASTITLMACGDDSSIADEPENVGHFREILSQEDLYACTSRYEGTSVFLIDEKRSFKCEDGTWYEISVEQADEDMDVIKSTLKYAADDTITSLAALPMCTASKDSSTLYIASLGKYLICLDFDWFEIEGKKLPKRNRIPLDKDSSEVKSSSSSRAVRFSSGSKHYPLSASSGDATCNASTEGTLKKSGDNYMCRSGAWFIVDEQSVDLMNVGDTTDGTFFVGILDGNVREYSSLCRSPDSIYKHSLYVYEGGWRKATALEACFEKACFEANYGDTDSLGVFKFICSSQGWRSVDILEDSIKKETFFNSELTYGTLTDERDNKVYKTIKIGNYTWMAENLNFVDSIDVSFLSLIGQSHYYLDDPDGLNVGHSYTYTGAMNIPSTFLSSKADSTILKKHHRGICPSGWHVPDTSEWGDLGRTVEWKSAALKSSVGWNFYSEAEDMIPTNATGFSAVKLDSYSDVYCASNQGTYRDEYFVFSIGYNSKILNIIDDYEKEDHCLLRCVMDYEDESDSDSSSSESSSDSSDSSSASDAGETSSSSYSSSDAVSLSSSSSSLATSAGSSAGDNPETTPESNVSSGN